MITDQETNIVYFSELLKTDKRYDKTCNEIIHILDDCRITCRFLPNTSDIWARDYMPIQVSENKFIEYRYDPDYLQGAKKGRRDLKSYPDIICESINLKTFKTEIILDGGNIVKSSNSVILTDKIVKENICHYNQEELIEELKILFEVEKVILIPWDSEAEEYGHADGMIRFIDDSTVLLHSFYRTYPEEFKNKFYESLSENGLKLREFIFDVPAEDDRNWAYINYLQTRDIILLPKLNIDEDQQAFEQMQKFFPSYAERDRIKQIDMTAIVKNGGALNCISWSINQNEYGKIKFKTIS